MVFLETFTSSQACWHTPFILALRRQRKEKCCESSWAVVRPYLKKEICSLLYFLEISEMLETMLVQIMLAADHWELAHFSVCECRVRDVVYSVLHAYVCAAICEPCTCVLRLENFGYTSIFFT